MLSIDLSRLPRITSEQVNKVIQIWASMNCSEEDIQIFPDCFQSNLQIYKTTIEEDSEVCVKIWGEAFDVPRSQSRWSLR